ncbi:cytochrome P450 [Mollisia scopiformis]|uniref:Cytochrome P450 n=1 Tax=Mollisia scopiformis TaxID=149040 RepID=A0A194X2H3_MOLSC|nr:cytochrome P450 [Mollisia scopiformis]KUJ14209.1 cytochrome P450 [Mollisia scopiformis]
MASLQKGSPLDTLLEIGRTSSVLSPGTIGLFLTLLLWTLYKQATQAQVPKIAKTPEAPDTLPFVGNLMSLGGRLNENDCTIYSRWSKKLGNDIFQMRLGSERALVVNTFAKIKDLWVGHSNYLIDKPQQHGFAKLLEQTHLDIYPYLRQIVFDLALSLTYGTVSSGVDDEFTDALVASINQISYFRASTQRFRDYVPMLRLLVPSFASGNLVASAEKERQKRLDVIYAALKERTAAGEQADCIVNGLVKDNLSEGEIHRTCKALLQAAPDSTASSVYLVIGWFSTPEGREFQDLLYKEILKVYGGDRDKEWKMAFREESVELLVSLYKETLRFWTTTPFAVPRTTVKDVNYAGTTIPKGTTMIMSAQQANHDEAWHGDDAKTFKPARFVGNPTSLPHLTFGAGARICPAAALSNRII